MNGAFYAGHGIGWMQKFLDAVPNKQRTSKSIAYALASCIHHQVIYTKNTNITLTHKKLNSFGLDRRYIQSYLFYFQEAGLINYTIKKGSAPKIQLIALSKSTLLTTNNSTKAIKATYNKGTGVLKSTGGCPLKYRLDALKSTGSNSRRTKEPSKGTKQGNLPSKGTKEVKGVEKKLITIEKFFRPYDMNTYLRFQIDDFEDLLLLDSLLSERFKIIEKNKNNVIVVFEKEVTI